MIDYLIEASICIAAFYACYWFNLSRLKLLNLNRGYLLITLLLSLAIPMLDISLYQTELIITPEVSDYISSSASLNPEKVIADKQMNPILLIWLIGAVIAGLAFIFRLIRVVQLTRKYPKQKTGRLWHVSIPAHQSVSSFFHFVFIPEGLNTKSDEGLAVLKHEEKHAQDRHSLDLILVELMTVLFWFHPSSYWYRKALKLQHEYIADEAVLSNYEQVFYTDLLVRYSLKQSGFSLAHSFSEHPVEKRLKMIDNTKATKMKKLRSVLIPLPLVAILLITIGCAQKAPVTITSTEKEATSLDEVSNKLLERIQKGYAEAVLSSSIKGKVQAASSGTGLEGVSIIAHPSGNLVASDEEGLYEFKVPSSDTLVVYSKSGYISQTIPRKNFSVINVALTKKDK